MQTQEVFTRPYTESAVFTRTVSNLYKLATSLSEDPAQSLLMFNYELQMQHFMIAHYSNSQIGANTSRKMVDCILYTIAMVMQETHPIAKVNRSIMDCLTEACTRVSDGYIEGFEDEEFAREIRQGADLAKSMHDKGNTIEQTIFLTEFLFCFRA